MLEREVVTYGSPTLARLKLGSLFTVQDSPNLDDEIEDLNDMFRGKGVILTPLRERNGRTLMYLYRTAELEQALEDNAIQSFLRGCGYSDFRTEAVLAVLREKLAFAEEFPHEIGVFLGYPLQDVVEFIRNDGQNCLCCGCWKVYSNECEALRSFARIRKCKEVYGRLFASGCPLSRLTVSTRTA